MELDAPEHEDDAGDHAEDQGVGEVPKMESERTVMSC